MGFQIFNPLEYRQRINLSNKAWTIMQEDKAVFGITGNATFINRIIANFHDSAKASCEIYLQNMKSELTERYADSGMPDSTISAMVQIYIDKEREHLRKITDMQKKEKCHSDIYRLNKANIEYLQSSECIEDQFYSTYKNGVKVELLGLYLKCLMEEYADLPYIQRERICFREFYETIETAIKHQELLKACLADGRPLYIYPYQLIEDPLSTRYYLACYTKRERAGTDKKPASLRISRLKGVRPLHANGKLNETEKQELERNLAVRSVQFLVENEDEIHVYLTDAGIRKYHLQLHLRPTTDSVLSDQHTYVFHCTQSQIEFYFFKFGKDAQILKPTKLREKFQKMYAEALDSYR
ncbi:MAG: WYL domain-containing protein [Clostridiales bacterium]|nr:WYL domain-containing protein [Clostridiales bacterium]